MKIRFMVVSAFTMLALSGCGNEEQAKAYGSLADSVLIANGTCASQSDCETKRLVKTEAGFDRAKISVFNTDNPAAIAAIERSFKQHRAYNKGGKVSLTFYSSKQGEESVKLRETEIE